MTKPVQHGEVLVRINAHLTIRKLQRQLQERNGRLKAQNELLEEQNQRFRTLSDATFEGILIHDGGRILEVNQAIETMSGYSRSDMLGKNVSAFVTSASRQTVLAHLQALDDGPYETEGVRKDGTTFPVELQARTIPYQGQEVRVVAIRDLSWRKTLEQEKQQLLSATIHDRYRFGDIIGKSQVMQAVYESIISAAASDANVVIYGGSGTGKELVSRTIHQLSERKDQAFVAVNCGAVPETLFEREFFGHRKGTFTGAIMDRAGYFDQAHGGTLFLDEVAELSQAMQVKLLRVLQDGEYTPLGDTKSKTADVRIIAATNKNLKDLLQQGGIREDFFYRIRVMVIDLPLLRERKEDIPLLIEHFLEQYGKEKEYAEVPGHIMEALCSYDWPGNVRELQNELQRYLAEQHLEFLRNVHAESVEQNTGVVLGFDPTKMLFWEAVQEFEKYIITHALSRNNWHRGKTAKMLQIPERTLYNKMRKYGLKRGQNDEKAL